MCCCSEVLKRSRADSSMREGLTIRSPVSDSTTRCAARLYR